MTSDLLSARHLVPRIARRLTVVLASIHLTALVARAQVTRDSATGLQWDQRAQRVEQSRGLKVLPPIGANWEF